MIVLAGAVGLGLAALLGGITGFGYGLVATPWLLLLGYPLDFVIVVNMLLGMSTRVLAAVTLRQHMNSRRVLLLLVSNVPGIAVGVVLLRLSDPAFLQRAVGVSIVGAAILVSLVDRVESRSARGDRAIAVAGFAGGALGATSTLNGIPPAVLYASEPTEPRVMVADLSAYFVVSNLAVAVVVWASTGPALHGITTSLLWWLPAVLTMTWVSEKVRARLPVGVFRRLAIALILAAGVSTFFAA